MAYEVVVVGGGIGGLTTAALLSARGVSVCLLERASRAGGCAASFEHSGHEFESGAGLYAGWGPGGLHERVFAELPVKPPEAREVSPAYNVRLPGSFDVRVGGGAEEFHETLRAAFPECADAAVRFYRDASQIGDALRRAARRSPALAGASRLQLMRLAASEPRLAPRILGARGDTAAKHLADTSARFRRFVDAQLQTFALCPSDSCSYLYAAVALTEPLRPVHALRGGAQALADVLVESTRKSGGTVRLDTTALRLAFDSRGRANGVTLLSGETVGASRAVVSNLTVWDTYGKLLGAEHTPAHVRARLKALRGPGAYQIFMSLDEEAARRLPSDRVLALDDRQEGREFDAEGAPFMLGTAPAWDARAPEGRRAANVTAFTDAEQWFAFHSDETEHEEQDARALEALWSRLHAALPELGAGAEVFETATPRTFYERTRRRLGMVGGLPRTPDLLEGPHALTHRTSVPNLLLVGDTVFPGAGVAAVTHAALVVANEIAPAGQRTV
ncbi:MAG TPA: NAD(P)/FAD-dependent oxidoreductase [Pyrinomonadaceae bacterium]|nr:NAD(P)/FAD-dependent oxidoreductase [Pyrinomonadaceae bacterium]